MTELYLEKKNYFLEAELNFLQYMTENKVLLCVHTCLMVKKFAFLLSDYTHLFQGDYDQAVHLLEEGAPVNVKDHAGWTPLVCVPKIKIFVPNKKMWLYLIHVHHFIINI